jgi:hypothetical protein
MVFKFLTVLGKSPKNPLPTYICMLQAFEPVSSGPKTFAMTIGARGHFF